MQQAIRTRRAVRFGVFEVDLWAGELRRQGIKIKLQEKPFQVLAMLLDRPGDVVMREELRTRLWAADTFVDFEKGINIAINKLREALGDSADNPRFIETKPRRGYRFIVPVEMVDAESRGAGAATPTVVERRAEVAPAVSGQKIPAQEQESTAKTRRRRFLERVWGFRVGLGISIVALLVVAYFVWRPRPAGKTMMVVLPFDSLGHDPEQEPFVDGLTDETIAQLAGLDPERLGVIARTTAMTYKHTNKNVQQIGRELGVRYALEGTVLRDANRVRITAQLVQCRDQTHLWAKTYDRDLRDIFTVQSDVSQAIAGQIRIKLTPQQQARLASPRSVNPEAYDAYLKGRFFWNKRYQTEEELKKGIASFQEAIQKDPNFALAYAGLADSYSLLGSIGHDVRSPREVMPKAKDAALHALELDDTLAEAHVSLAFIILAYDWNFQGADKEFQRAIELNAGYATAHQWYAWYLTAVGRMDEAAAENLRAEQLDPRSLVIRTQIAWHHYMARQYDQAIRQSRRALEMDPNSIVAYYCLGQAYLQKGMYAESIAELQKGKNLSGGAPLMLMALGHAYAVSGNKPGAANVLNELRSLSKHRYLPAIYIAAIYAGLGDKDQAFEWLEKAYQQRSDYLILLRMEPMADGLRSDPRFAALLQRIGLPVLTKNLVGLETVDVIHSCGCAPYGARNEAAGKPSRTGAVRSASPLEASAGSICARRGSPPTLARAS